MKEKKKQKGRKLKGKENQKPKWKKKRMLEYGDKKETKQIKRKMKLTYICKRKLVKSKKPRRPKRKKDRKLVN